MRKGFQYRIAGADFPEARWRSAGGARRPCHILAPLADKAVSERNTYGIAKGLAELLSQERCQNL
jgi:hypothetical protein